MPRPAHVILPQAGSPPCPPPVRPGVREEEDSAIASGAGQEDRARTIAGLRTLIASVESEWGTPDRSAEGLSSADSLSPAGGLSSAGDLSSCRRQDPSPENPEPAPITDLEQARNIALHRLSTRARSTSELKKDLLQRHVDEKVADQVLARFVEVGLVDDESFAREWVASRRTTKSLSAARLRRELTQKGIQPSVIDEALGEAAGSEAEIALDLARKRAKSLVGKDRATMTRRLAAQLERRGFSPAVVRRAVIQAVDEAADGASDDGAD